MRNSANILIYVNVQKALDTGIQFFLSCNGVVLTEGDESGYLRPQFFQRVTDKKGKELDDWKAASDANLTTVHRKTKEPITAHVEQSTPVVGSSES
jgi:2'-phosphotransferase